MHAKPWVVTFAMLVAVEFSTLGAHEQQDGSEPPEAPSPPWSVKAMLPSQGKSFHSCYWYRVCSDDGSGAICSPLQLGCDLIDTVCYPVLPPSTSFPDPPPWGGGVNNPHDTNNDSWIDCYKAAVARYLGTSCCGGWGVNDSACNPPCTRGHVHKGLDLAAPEGTAVRSVFRGTVVQVIDARNYRSAFNTDGCGNRIKVQGQDGLIALYCHLSEVRQEIQVGKTVYPGQALGAVGNTGCGSCGYHLHLEIRTVDPPASLSDTLNPAQVFGQCNN